MEKIGTYILREKEQDKLILDNGLKYIVSNKKYYSPKREVEKIVGFDINFKEVKSDKHKKFNVLRG